MNKSKTKIYDGMRAEAIKWAANEHSVSREYVRAIINGTSTGGRSEEILKDFRMKYAELKQVLS